LSTSPHGYYTEHTSTKLTLFYVHCALLANLSLAANSHKQWQFERLVNRLAMRDHVYMYSGSEFDQQIHEEIKRMKRVAERGLIDQVVFKQNVMNGREITDYVYLDVLHERETD
jgi:hypothetical protein